MSSGASVNPSRRAQKADQRTQLYARATSAPDELRQNRVLALLEEKKRKREGEARRAAGLPPLPPLQPPKREEPPLELAKQVAPPPAADAGSSDDESRRKKQKREKVRAHQARTLVAPRAPLHRGRLASPVPACARCGHAPAAARPSNRRMIEQRCALAPQKAKKERKERKEKKKRERESSSDSDSDSDSEDEAEKKHREEKHEKKKKHKKARRPPHATTLCLLCAPGPARASRRPPAWPVIEQGLLPPGHCLALAWPLLSESFDATPPAQEKKEKKKRHRDEGSDGHSSDDEDKDESKKPKGGD